MEKFRPKRQSVVTGIVKPVRLHTQCRCFANHLLRFHYDVRTIWELLGHNDVNTTMIFTHTLDLDGLAVRSALD